MSCTWWMLMGCEQHSTGSCALRVAAGGRSPPPPRRRPCTLLLCVCVCKCGRAPRGACMPSETLPSCAQAPRATKTRAQARVPANCPLPQLWHRALVVGVDFATGSPYLMKAVRCWSPATGA